MACVLMEINNILEGDEKMPKVMLTETDRDKENFERTIRKYAGANLLSMPQVAKLAKIPYQTLYKRMLDPDSFRRGEMRRLFKVLKIPPEERNELF